MRDVFLSVLMFFCCCWGTVSCEKRDSEAKVSKVSVTEVRMNKTSLTLTEGETEMLYATVFPSNADNKDIAWFSNDSSIASVENGLVTANSYGTTVIAARSPEGFKSAACDVTVLKKVIHVTSVTLYPSKKEVFEGQDFTFSCYVEPYDATNRAVLWDSSDPAVASVDGGNVTANSIGTAIITVTSEDGGISDSCEVTVIEKPIPVIDVSSVSLNKTEIEIYRGEQTSLIATIEPENATNKTVNWYSSDTRVAEVEKKDDMGIIKAKTPGFAVITAQAEDRGHYAQCVVTVLTTEIPATALLLNRRDVVTFEGNQIILFATVVPENASNKTVLWSSSDPSILSVENGVVTANKEGRAYIRAVVNNENGYVGEHCYFKVLKKDGTGNNENVDFEDWN